MLTKLIFLISLLAVSVNFTLSAHAEESATWLTALQTYQDLKVTTQAIKDFSEYKDRNGGKVEYEPTGQIFHSYEEIKAAIPHLKSKQNKLVVEYSESIG